MVGYAVSRILMVYSNVVTSSAPSPNTLHPPKHKPPPKPNKPSTPTPNPHAACPENTNTTPSRGESAIFCAKLTTARALLLTLRLEQAHLQQPAVIVRPRERDVRATCDTCMASIFSLSWLCRLCGREACADCHSTVCDSTLELAASTSSASVAEALEEQGEQGQGQEDPQEKVGKEQEQRERREKHAHANPFFLIRIKRVEHKDGRPLAHNVAVHTRLAHACYLPPTLGAGHAIGSGEPPGSIRGAVDAGVLRGAVWGQGCLVIECQSEVNKRVSVGEFFRVFGRYSERSAVEGGALTLAPPTGARGRRRVRARSHLGRGVEAQDWPPSADFRKAFPEL
ncbi:hypothetical protein DXG01_005541 [Tephrocybe rancida]|nr:hypothetical protein DXG01_005541 [Tephrocybe rancida]